MIYTVHQFLENLSMHTGILDTILIDILMYHLMHKRIINLCTVADKRLSDPPIPILNSPRPASDRKIRHKSSTAFSQ